MHAPAKKLERKLEKDMQEIEDRAQHAEEVLREFQTLIEKGFKSVQHEIRAHDAYIKKAVGKKQIKAKEDELVGLLEDLNQLVSIFQRLERLKDQDHEHLQKIGKAAAYLQKQVLDFRLSLLQGGGQFDNAAQAEKYWKQIYARCRETVEGYTGKELKELEQIRMHS